MAKATREDRRRGPYKPRRDKGISRGESEAVGRFVFHPPSTEPSNPGAGARKARPGFAIVRVWYSEAVHPSLKLVKDMEIERGELPLLASLRLAMPAEVIHAHREL